MKIYRATIRETWGSCPPAPLRFQVLCRFGPERMHRRPAVKLRFWGGVLGVSGSDTGFKAFKLGVESSGNFRMCMKCTSGFVRRSTKILEGHVETRCYESMSGVHTAPQKPLANPRAQDRC